MAGEGRAYEFNKAEIDLDGKLFTAISNLQHNQPIEEGVAYGAAPQPLARTTGQLGMGQGNMEWSDLGELQDFIDAMGDGWQEREFKITATYSCQGRPTIRRTLLQCRLLDVAEDHSAGPDPLGGSMPFSFIRRELNGKRPLFDQRA